MNMKNKKEFEKSELPFLLIYEKNNNMAYSWFENEKELRIKARELKDSGYSIIRAIGDHEEIEIYKNGNLKNRIKKIGQLLTVPLMILFYYMMWKGFIIVTVDFWEASFCDVVFWGTNIVFHIAVIIKFFLWCWDE